MVILRELRSAFPHSRPGDRFFHDTGSVSLAADTALSVGYVLSIRMSECGTQEEERLEPVARCVVVDDCAAVSVGAIDFPHIETHVGFLVGTTITDIEQATDPTDCIAAAFPVLRIVTGGPDADTSTDRAPQTSVAIALGAQSIRRDAVRDLLATLNRNGRVVAAGEGASMQRSPYEGIAIAAQLRLGADSALRRGQLVLTGSMHRPVAVAPGDHFRADVLGLGSVCIRCAN
ncbi:MAG: fumarylacetoacetate hydrolase family protein [Mycobacterium sp.]